MEFELLVKARNLLQPLWGKAWLKTQHWRPKSESNSFSGLTANLIVGVGNEIILVSEQNGKLILKEFRISASTVLGRKARELLQEGGLIENPRLKISRNIISPSGYTALCSDCGWRKEFDPGFLSEVDNKGQGSRDLVLRMIESHKKASPLCKAQNLKIFDQNMVMQDGLMEIISLQQK